VRVHVSDYAADVTVAMSSIRGSVVAACADVLCCSTVSNGMAVVMYMSTESQFLLAALLQLHSHLSSSCYYASNCSSRGTMSVSAAVYVVLHSFLQLVIVKTFATST
jgi:hypothetical protein